MFKFVFNMRAHKTEKSAVPENTTCCFETIEELLKLGAKINNRDLKGYTPLCVAANNGNTDLVKYFIDKGAAINLETHRGFSPLYLAVANSHFETAKTLIELGANTTNVLVRSVSLGNVNALNVLKSLDLNFNVIILKNGYSLLHYAVSYGQYDATHWLIDEGVDVNIQDRIGNTPLHLAVHLGHEHIARLLLKRDADPNIKDTHGWTPRRWAVDLLLPLIDDLLAMYNGQIS